MFVVLTDEWTRKTYKTDITPAILSHDARCIKDAYNRAAFYSKNNSCDCATCHDATCDMPCQSVTLGTLMRNFVAGVTLV